MSRREAELEKKIESLSIRFAQAMAALEKAEEEISFLKKQLYGPKSDRPTEEVQFIMGELFYNEEEVDGSEEGEDDEDDPDPAGVETQPSADRGGRKQPPRKPSRLSLVNTGLEEREIVVVPADPEAYINPDTGVPYEILRYEETRRLAEEPANSW